MGCLDIQEKMPAGNTALMGLICGALPCILDKPNNSARVIPSLFTVLLVAFLDWTDDDTWFFVFACLLSHYMYSNNYPTRMVNSFFNLATSYCSTAYEKSSSCCATLLYMLVNSNEVNTFFNLVTSYCSTAYKKMSSFGAAILEKVANRIEED